MNNDNPLISFCLFAYNQQDFIEDAINGALSQTYSPLEIVISDDCSTDKTYEIIKSRISSYTGPHKIIINRNSKNLGIAKHFNKVVLDISHGDIIVLAGGDDISLPERTKRSYELFCKYPEIKSLSFDSLQVDVNVNPIVSEGYIDFSYLPPAILTLAEYLSFVGFIIFSGDSRAFRREILNIFGPINYAAAEDLCIFIRSLILGPICFSHEQLVKRRIHAHNVSAVHRYKKSNARAGRRQVEYDIKKALELGLISGQIASKLKQKHLMIQYLRLRAYYFYRLRIIINFLRKLRNFLLYQKS